MPRGFHVVDNVTRTQVQRQALSAGAEREVLEQQSAERAAVLKAEVEAEQSRYKAAELELQNAQEQARRRTPVPFPCVRAHACTHARTYTCAQLSQLQALAEGDDEVAVPPSPLAGLLVSGTHARTDALMHGRTDALKH